MGRVASASAVRGTQWATVGMSVGYPGVIRGIFGMRRFVRFRPPLRLSVQFNGFLTSSECPRIAWCRWTRMWVLLGGV